MLTIQEYISCHCSFYYSWWLLSVSQALLWLAWFKLLILVTSTISTSFQWPKKLYLFIPLQCFLRVFQWHTCYWTPAGQAVSLFSSVVPNLLARDPNTWKSRILLHELVDCLFSLHTDKSYICGIYGISFNCFNSFL